MSKIKSMMQYLDALERFNSEPAGRFDGDLAAFYGRQLEQINERLYEKRYPANKGRIFVPVKNDINPGAASLTNRTIDEAGQAEFVEDYGDDAPMVEVVGGSEDNYKMRRIQLGFGWHIDEARAAAFAGENLSDRKAMITRRRIEKFIDKTLLLGASVGGISMQGLFTLSGTQAPVTYTVQHGTWADETPDDILEDLCGIVDAIINGSLETEEPDTLIVPLSTFRLLNNRRMGDSNNLSILKHFLQTNDVIKNVYSSTYLEVSAGHGGGAAKRMVCYRRDPEILEGLVNEFEAFPPEYAGMRVRQICGARCGGVMTHYPKAIGYGDGI